MSYQAKAKCLRDGAVPGCLEKAIERRRNTVERGRLRRAIHPIGCRALNTTTAIDKPHQDLRPSNVDANHNWFIASHRLPHISARRMATFSIVVGFYQLTARQRPAET